jgi:hypothetical protein
VVFSDIMESGEVLDLANLRIKSPAREWFRFETPASGGRGAAGAHSRSKNSFVPASWIFRTGSKPVRIVIYFS